MTSKFTILLIDDDDNDNFFHKRAIEKSGLKCDVRVCTGAVDALDYLQNKGSYADASSEYPKPDIIFLDINMPIVNGWDFLESYAALPDELFRKPKVVIVMLSTSSNQHDRNRAQATKLVTEFMEKPLRPDGLVSLVHKYIESNLTIEEK
ncbi:MAG: response regulator [Granulosicoccus sp.]